MKFSEYRDRVRACWLGKNIGGTLGGPLEGARGVFDITYYVHDISKGVLPNDDLDLQLVWLLAAEAAGRAVDSDVLGEYWLTHIPCDWSEYGAGKVNLKTVSPHLFRAHTAIPTVKAPVRSSARRSGRV